MENFKGVPDGEFLRSLFMGNFLGAPHEEFFLHPMLVTRWKTSFSTIILHTIY